MIKFKRRTRFLGFYVQVLAKALQEGLTETALEWSSDTIGWMMRYSEVTMGFLRATSAYEVLTKLFTFIHDNMIYARQSA